ncbi:MAG: hypothetical protein V3R81_05355, partial [Gammaproteobacteria bacterium]
MGPSKVSQGARVPLGEHEDRGAGLELLYTKVAVDLQSLSLENAEQRIKASLQVLTDATGCDAVFIALFDPDSGELHTVYSGRAVFAVCNPEVLRGTNAKDIPYLTQHLDHMRLVEIADTDQPAARQRADAEVLAKLKIGALIGVGFEAGPGYRGLLGVCSGSARPRWGADL